MLQDLSIKNIITHIDDGSYKYFENFTFYNYVEKNDPIEQRQIAFNMYNKVYEVVYNKMMKNREVVTRRKAQLTLSFYCNTKNHKRAKAVVNYINALYPEIIPQLMEEVVSDEKYEIADVLKQYM